MKKQNSDTKEKTNNIEILLGELARNGLLTSAELAKNLNWKVDKVYHYLAVAQGVNLIESKRRDVEGSNSPKVYKITRAGMRKIKADPNDTPAFSNQAVFTLRRLVIERINREAVDSGYLPYTGEEAIQALSRYIAELEKCAYHLARQMVADKISDIVAVPDGVKRPKVFIVMHPNSFNTAVLRKIDAFASPPTYYVDFIIVPLTADQETSLRLSDPMQALIKTGGVRIIPASSFVPVDQNVKNEMLENIQIDIPDLPKPI